MSLFRYKVVLADGKEKTSKITAKTKETAQIRVAALNAVKKWLWIREEKSPIPAAPLAKPPAPAKPKSVSLPSAAKFPSVPKPAPDIPTKPLSAKKQSKLAMLLFHQDGNCFFCGKHLAKENASIEHLQPKSGGGNDADGNVVACCVALNRTLGDMNLKAKVAMILKKSGHFTCPAD